MTGDRSRLLVRLLLALSALLLSAAVVQQGVANWLARVRPAQAAHLAPWDARIAVEAARAAIDAGASPSAPKVQALAGRALSRDATLTAAIEFRALAAEAAGDGEKALRLYRPSSSTSRRSLPTRLWLIESAVGRGDVAGALDQFDIALRTSSAAPDILFPVLARAASDPALVAPIARVLDRATEWRAMFLHYAISEAETVSDTAEVVMLMRDRPMITESGIDDGLIAQLLAERDFSSARRVYDAFHGGRAQSDLVRDGRFADAGTAFPFGWGLIDKGKVGAMRTLVGNRTVLTYHARPDGDGRVAAQLLMLAEGAYTLSVATAEAAADPMAPAYWTVTCGEENGAQIASLDQPVGRGASASTGFTVPAGCAAQWIALNVRLSDAPQGQHGSVAFVAVTHR